MFRFSVRMSPIVPFEFNVTNDGFWGDTTATLDWCEGNYEVSWYIAEFYNTLTNLAMIVPACYGIHKVRKHNLETRFLVSYVMLLTVGVGSSLFHMTLKYWGQILDELPMVYSSCTFIYSLYMIQTKENEKWLVFSLSFYCTAFAVVYLFIPNPLVFQTMYGITVVVIVLLSANVLRSTSTFGNKNMFWGGLATFLSAFMLWNIDSHFCHDLETFREKSSLSLLKPFSQLHGWWHILTGYATYMKIQFCVYNRLKYLRQEPVYTLDCMGIGVVVNSKKAE